MPESQRVGCDTTPKLLIENADRYANRTAIREKDLGIWQSWSWLEMKQEIFDLAHGLAALGFKRGDKLAIIGNNRPRLYWGMTAAQCLGGVPVPVYQDSVSTELHYVLDHAGIRFVLAEDQEQVDKVIEIQAQCPQIEGIIYDDPRGLRDYDKNYAHGFIHAFEYVQQTGRDFAADHAGLLAAAIEQGRGTDVSIMLYTSGTTGKPKGVVLSFDNVLITARNSIESDHLGSDEETLSYLPMAWVGDHIFSVAQAYVAGFCISCPESEATVANDLKEIGPTYYFAPPRIFENLLTTVMIRMEDAGRLKRSMFNHFMAVAKRVGVRLLNGETVRLTDRVSYALGNLLVYGPLKNSMGFSRIRLAYTAGEAIGSEIFDFYRSLGINIKQLYGQTEAAVFITMQPDGEVFADTVGTPAPEVEIRIEDDGEVVYRSPGVFLCYYKNETETAATKTTDGWVHTGDAGFFGANGHLKIIDRAKDVGKLNNGSIFAPKYLENKLKFFPQIREAVTFGDQRDFVCAFLNIDLEAVGNWAERNNIPYASYQELASNDEVYRMMQQNIEQMNRELASDQHMAGSQVTRFLVLHKELDPDDGELTRTRKVRRSVITEKYGVLIEALYANADRCRIETEVTFEDGRKGVITGDLRINGCEVFAAVAKAS